MILEKILGSLLVSENLSRSGRNFIEVEEQINNLVNNHKIGAIATSDLSIPTGAYTDIIFQNILYGEAAYFTNNKNLVAKEDGLYLVTASVRFAVNATGIRQLAISASNGDITEISLVPVSGYPSIFEATLLTKLTVGQTVKGMVFQSSGGALNIKYEGNTTYLRMVKVG